jgi:hypothetical protein
MQTTPKDPLFMGIRGRCPRCGEGKLFHDSVELSGRTKIRQLLFGGQASLGYCGLTLPN